MNPALQSLLALVRKGPQPAKAFAKALNRSLCSTQNQLRHLRTLGLIDRTAESIHTVWCVPEAVEEAAAAIEASRALKVKADSQARYARQRRAALERDRVQAKEVEAAKVWEEKVVRRIVPASECPTPKLGVRSVFELAAA